MWTSQYKQSEEKPIAKTTWLLENSFCIKGQMKIFTVKN